MVPYECGESNLIRPIKRFIDWTVLFRLILVRNITFSSTYSVPEESVVGQASSLIPSDVVVNKKVPRLFFAGDIDDINQIVTHVLCLIAYSVVI